jgi:hypothetical protein
MAGFQLTLYGRIWVTPEEQTTNGWALPLEEDLETGKQVFV